VLVPEEETIVRTPEIVRAPPAVVVWVVAAPPMLRLPKVVDPAPPMEPCGGHNRGVARSLSQCTNHRNVPAIHGEVVRGHGQSAGTDSNIAVGDDGAGRGVSACSIGPEVIIGSRADVG